MYCLKILWQFYNRNTYQHVVLKIGNFLNIKKCKQSVSGFVTNIFDSVEGWFKN